MAKKGKAKKLCFVVGPIGDAESDIRIHADWLLEEIVEPTFDDFRDYEVVRADKISLPGMIDAQIIKQLFDADLVIADLSFLNPNAFYEIGIRHMVQKPIIHMQLASDNIPFDVSLYRAIKFSRVRPSEMREARSQLKLAIEAVEDESYEVENPVTRTRGKFQIEESGTPEQKLFMDQIDTIQRSISSIERLISDTTVTNRKGASPSQLDFLRTSDVSNVILFINEINDEKINKYSNIFENIFGEIKIYKGKDRLRINIPDNYDSSQLEKMRIIVSSDSDIIDYIVHH